MWSDKLTLSLTFLVVLLAFGLAVYTPSVMADGDTHDFSVTITAAENMVDVVSGGDGIQIASGRDRASRAITEGTATFITLLITTGEIVNLGDPDAGVTAADLTGRSGAAIAEAINERAAAVFDDSDIVIDAYDADGRSLGILPLAETDDVVILSHRDPTNPGKEFLARIDETKLTDAYTAARGGGQTLEIHTLLFSIPKAAMQQADIAHVTAVRNDAHVVHTNGVGKIYRVDLVDDDEGDAMYNVGVSDVEVGDGDGVAGTPGVVTIDTLRERAGIIESGPFDVKITLTEEPNGIADILKKPEMLIAVKNGSVTGLRRGTTLKGATEAEGRPASRVSELTLAMASYTAMDNTDATADELPEATGRDNMYHQYFATITPKLNFNGYVTVSIKQFSDKVLPVGRIYVPLTDAQIVATTLDPATEENVRDARVKNETLMVKVGVAADTTSKSALAKAAYDKRQKDVFDKIANEHVLGNKLVVPAGGYLVLAKDLGKAGIQGSDAKLKDKTGAELLYNTTGLDLKFPADDLDNFFRNGGTLTLSYADIAAATGSGHGDSKGGTGDDNTGYSAADSTAYAAGALIINEIMWGLNGGADPLTGSQYIELHNPGTAAIGIDNKEWVITVGSAPAGFTPIDSAGNNPASGFWAAPGNGGVTEVKELYPVLIDLVSMSRVAGSADGTAAASWAASIRPSANIGGRRIGTPGAANEYMMPDVVTPPVATTPPVVAPTPVAVATAADIAISEIMYSTGRGNLPQWIEITNVSASEVSLEGWDVEIENEDGSDLSITLGATTVGASEAALLVSKNGRNSGVSDDPEAEGDIRRVVNLKDLGVTGTLLSSMGFTITLVPPAAAGSSVRTDGDSAGGMDWELAAMDGDRSSLIRKMNADGTYQDGSMRMSWHATTGTGRYGTYYGHPSDMGTPGYVMGGPLPVELSMFYPARDKLTGQVVITWETQSELNNAGFFIKRSEAKNGKFVVINPTMIPGAGTTAEKQSYTHTDTTAKPNVLYYYQIEDVSLDGKRATLTGAHRLRGHIGAAGKVTTIWGELKAQE